MKTQIKFPEYLAGLLLFLSFLLPAQVQAQYDDVSLETFYEELSPYGVWINDPQYGQVWRPDVDQDEFRPYYTNGHWEMTKYGNTWVSNYEWGWAPFHYGRWHYGNRRGWIWIPDTRWGPAWVTWRSGGGHYGWAPLGPGINININIGSRIPDYYWVFVPQRNIYYDRYPRYDRYRNRNIYNNTVIINNTYVYNRNRYFTGPRLDEIRRVTRQPVPIRDVRNNRPMNYGNSRSDRPESNRMPDRSGNPGQNPRPARPTDNSGGRGAVTGRGSDPLVDNSLDRGAVKPESRQIPASSQRSGRTYDNQDSRGSQNHQNGQGSPVTDRQEQVRQSPQVIREQRPERVGQAQNQGQNQRTAPQERQAPAPERIDRSEQQRQNPVPERVQRSEPQQRQAPAPERIERSAPQDRQAPAENSGRRDNSSPGQESGRSSQNRPSRGN
jgi:hypothetical protein